MDSKADREGPGGLNQQLLWAGPRTVVVPRSTQGFGFTLRHFVVYPPEPASRSSLSEDGDGSPWQSSEGQGPEPLDTIFVKTVREGSTAHLAGLTAGDRIVAVNSEPVSGKSYAEVIALIHASPRSLKLLVVPKDEDILQMAYQSQSRDDLSDSSASLCEPAVVSDMQDPPSHTSPVHKTSVQLAMSGSGGQRSGGQHRYTAHGPHHTYTFGLDGGGQDEARGRREEFGRIRSSQVQGGQGGDLSQQRRTSTPGRPMSQDSGMRLAGGVPTSKAKYSFGLYFPPRHTPATSLSPASSSSSAQSRATSADNLTHSVPVMAERRFRVDSDTSSSTSGSAHDGGSVCSGGREVEGGVVVRTSTSTSTPSPRQSYAQDSSGLGGDYKGRYYVPVLNQSSSRPSSDASSYSSEFRTRPGSGGSDRSQRASVGGSVTVTTQSAADRPQRASLGSSLGSSMSSSLGSSMGSSMGRTRDYMDGSGGGGQGHTTFVVRIPVTGTPTSAAPNNFGSSFAVTRSPRHTTIDVQQCQPPTSSQSVSQPTHIEVQPAPPPSSSSKGKQYVEVQHQSSPSPRYGSPGPMEGGVAANGNNARSVWQRKVLFENGQNENNMPITTKLPSRLRTELDKLTSQRKFTSVACRMASFEKSSDEDGERTPGRENTPPTHPPQQPAVKVRRVSVEKLPDSRDTVFTEPSASDSYTSVTDSFVKVDHRLGGEKGDELSAGTVSGGSSSTPVRIFVSPGSRRATSPPMVEIVPVCSSEGNKDRHPPPPITLLPTQPSSSQPVQVVQPIIRESKSLPPDPVLHRGFREPYSMHPEPQQMSSQRPLSVHEWPRGGGDGDWQHQHQLQPGREYSPAQQGIMDTDLNSRPQRKSSYLTAVNAPTVRYTPSPDDDEGDLLPVQHESSSSVNFFLPQHGPPSSVMSSSDSAVTFSRPSPPVSAALSASTMEPLPSVVLRKKTADTVEDSMAKLHRRTSYLMATARDRANNPVALEPPHPAYSSPFSGSIPEEPISTPSIVEATERYREPLQQPQPPESPLPDVTRAGSLWCKTAMSEGKKCSDRSWKQVWAVLRGHALFLIKDRRDGSTPPTFSFEEPPISIKSCLVDIARDYSRKRKHVFRLSTCSESVYLLQAEDQGTMMSWIQAIKTNNHPDGDEEGIGSAELIRRKVSTQSDSGLLQTSPQTAHREKDKAKFLAGISFKAKLPHSPSVRRKKPEDSGSSKKGGWKGFIPRSFKKQATDDSALLEETEDISKCTFGIPLEDCFPSPNNEFVPLIVELCTRIVEVRGLEIVGVYRVPGNSVSVTHMQDELNRGIENMNMDNDKWLDVNVVSSLLKAFFRKLPHPLVTPDLYDAFIEANRNPDPEKRMLKLKRLLQMLPEHHYETFKHLAEHLSSVANHGPINKMDAKNLAIMFGPTLIRKVEEDTVSLVNDMSDQCRIVESIILHNDWFFSDWDNDHFVPQDSGEHVHPTATDRRTARDDDEDADSVINTKEIISSIVNAANKKLKLRLENKSTDSLDLDSTLSQHSTDTITSTSTSTIITTTTTHHQKQQQQKQQQQQQQQLRAPAPLTGGGGGGAEGGEGGGGGGFQERSVDAAIARATIIAKSQTSLASSRSASEDCLDRHTSTTAPLATSEPDFLDWDERHHYAGGRGGRHMSDDTLLERSDEVVGGWNGRDTLDWLKRLEHEARTIRRLEEQRQRDMERRRRQQQKIERELQRSQRDLEMEDAQSVEDLLAWSSSPPVTSTSVPTLTLSARPLPYPNSSSSTSASSSSRPQPLTSADAATFSRDYPDSHRFPTTSPTRPASKSSFPELTASGGKYFVSVANNRDSFVRPSASLENLLEAPPSHFSHTGSLENMLDPPHQHRDAQHTFGPHPGIGHGPGGSLRHGSLDSLLNIISHEPQGGGSTDSEDGSDLLTSLTTTFDQKLQILLNPKYRLASRHGHGRHPSHHHHAGARQSGLFSAGDLSRSASATAAPSESVHHGGDGMGGGGGGGRGGRGEVGFRDPSLHRASKSDPKIGIASRFQWGPGGASCGGGGGGPQGGGSGRHHVKPLPDFRSFLSRGSGKPEGGPGNVVLTQPRKLTSGRGDGRGNGMSSGRGEGGMTPSSHSVPSRLSESAQPSRTAQQQVQQQQQQQRLNYRPFSKTEKMEVNTALARMLQRDTAGARDSISSSGSSSQQSADSGSHQSSRVGVVEGRAMEVWERALPAKADGSQPTHSSERGEGGRRGRGARERRHTVGGVGDLDHFKALLAVTGQCSDDAPRPSAWDQLCAASASSPSPSDPYHYQPQGRSLQAWMREERLRGSTPNLLTCHLSPSQSS